MDGDPRRRARRRAGHRPGRGALVRPEPAHAGRRRARRAAGPAVVDHVVPVPVAASGATTRRCRRPRPGSSPSATRRAASTPSTGRGCRARRCRPRPSPRPWPTRACGATCCPHGSTAPPPGSSTPRGRSRWAPTSSTRARSARRRRAPTWRTATPSDSCGRPTARCRWPRTFNRVVNLVDPPTALVRPSVVARVGAASVAGGVAGRPGGPPEGGAAAQLNRTRPPPVSPCVTAVEVRVSSQWLRLREPADAAARSPDLARRPSRLPGRRDPVVVHDLGCGSGSMGRWLAPLLDGPAALGAARP